MPSSTRDVTMFYLDSIHNDPRILYADSLAWFFEQTKAEELFKGMVNTLQGSKKRFVQSRILSIQAEWDRIDPALFNELNSLPESQKDIHVMTALYWVDANLYTLTDQKENDFYHIHHQVAYYLNNYKVYKDEMEHFIEKNQNIKFRSCVLGKLLELTEISLYTAQRDDDLKNLVLEKYGDTSKLQISKEYYGKILTNQIYHFIVIDPKVLRGDSILRTLDNISKDLEPCHFLRQKWDEYSFIIQKNIDDQTKIKLIDDMISKHKTCHLTYTLPQFWSVYAVPNPSEKHKISMEHFIKSRPFSKHILRQFLGTAFIDFYIDKNKFDVASSIAYNQYFTRAKVTNVEEALSYGETYSDFININNLSQIKMAQYEIQKSDQILDEFKKLCDKSYQLYNKALTFKKENQSYIMNQSVGMSILDNNIYVYYLLSQKEPKYQDDFLKLIIQSRANLLSRDILANKSHPVVAKERKLYKEKKMLELKGEQSSDDYRKTLQDHTNAAKARTLWSKKDQPSFTFFKEANIPLPDVNTTHIYIKFVRRHYYITILNRTNQETYTIQSNDHIKAQWNLLDTMIRSQVDDPKKFNKVASELGQWLFPVKYQKMIRQNIVLHADEWFSRIPLAVLQFSPAQNASSWDNLPSIGKTYNISNSYEIPIPKSQTLKPNPKVAIFTFSAEEDIHKKSSNSRKAKSGLQMDELRESITEAYHIKSIFPDAQWYAGTTSTKDQFLKVLQDPDIDIIHLAQHGKSNGSEPEDVKLYFKNKDGSVDSLMGPELIGLKTNATLIVLSACETGVGFEYIGEGIFSFGRYFMAAGAKNIVTSMWETDDKHTPKMMKQFYQEIKSTKGRSIKLNNDGTLNQHPKVVFPFILQTY